jgi:hypothetical protein
MAVIGVTKIHIFPFVIFGHTLLFGCYLPHGSILIKQGDVFSF